MMSPEITIAVCAIALALAFDFVNGFHDTANAVATVIYTKALKPQVAIIVSGLLNFLGALVVGTAVAKVITKIIPYDKVTLTIVIAVLIGGLIWNLLTWWFGLPVSSSHCLIGSLFGAGIAAGGMGGVNWQELNKVLLALILSPLAGFACGAVVTWLVLKAQTRRGGSSVDSNSSPLLRAMQVLSSAAVSFTHGSNDGQKTMGIITLILAISFPQFGYTPTSVSMWVIVAAAAAIGLGTTIGGWRVIRTVGTRITSGGIQYAHGFGAEFSTASVIYIASMLGAPISTTHTLTSAVAGGTIPASGAGMLNRKMIGVILAAWLITLPAVAALSAASYWTIARVVPAQGPTSASH